MVPTETMLGRVHGPGAGEGSVVAAAAVATSSNYCPTGPTEGATPRPDSVVPDVARSADDRL